MRIVKFPYREDEPFLLTLPINKRTNFGRTQFFNERIHYFN